MKASNANEKPRSREYTLPQQKFDEPQRKDEARRFKVSTEIKSNYAEDPFESRLPPRRDPPWLVVGIAAAFAIMFAGFFYSALK